MAQARSRIQELIGRVKNPAFALTAAGTLLAARARAAFDAQGHGRPWPARAVPNVPGILADLEAGREPAARRFEARPVLIDTGALRRSIRFAVSGRRLTLTASAPYASKHEKGGVVVRPIRRDVLVGLARLLSERPELRPKLGWLFTWAKQGRPLRTTVPARPFLRPTPRDLRDAGAAARRALQAGG